VGKGYISRHCTEGIFGLSDTVSVKFAFDREWQRGEDGQIEFQVLMSAEAGTFHPSSYVMLRLAVLKSPSHMEAVSLGKDKPAIVQLGLAAPSLARQMGEALIAAADVVEGRGKPVH
jgi:hypothetical protein